jgi:hypothetical protein
VENSDFVAFYTGAVIAWHGDFRNLHNVPRETQIQRAAAPSRQFPVEFVRPHVYAAILAPLALFSLRGAFVAWLLAHTGVLLACWWWAWRRFGSDAVPLLALFPAAIMSYAYGQDVVLFLGLFVLSYALFERDRPMLSGFVLGLAFIKPHLLLLLVVAPLLQRRWRMLAGLAIGGALEAGISLALGGFEGAMNYVRFLQSRQDNLSTRPERMMNVYGIGHTLGIQSSLLNITLAAAVLACFVIICRRGAGWHAFAAGIAGTLLIAPHTYLYDSTLALLPALLIVFQASGIFARAAAAAYCTPLPSLLQLADPPWTMTPTLILLLLLAALAAETLGLGAPLPKPAPAASEVS